MSTFNPDYIVIEGPIGVGKTTLAKKLAATFGTDLLLEGADENPFLERFYRNPKEGALPTQLFFLLQRAQQVQSLRQSDMFQSVRVADFLVQKDRLFAELTLDEHEFKLYEQVYAHLTLDAPTPDLVIYLQAPVDTLLMRIQRRGRAYEQKFDPAYLRRLSDAYASFFHHYNDAPLLIVNAAHIDLANNEYDYTALLKQIESMGKGRQYFNPMTASL